MSGLGRAAGSEMASHAFERGRGLVSKSLLGGDHFFNSRIVDLNLGSTQAG